MTAGTDAGRPLTQWQRLDWTVLVQAPRQEMVWAGPDDDGLQSALPLLQVPVVRVSTPSDWEARPDGSSDLVLLVGPSRPDVVNAARVLRPGGWVCALYPRRARSLTSPTPLWSGPRLLRSLGLREVDAYWHAPGLWDSTRIVPLASRPGVRQALLRHQGLRLGRLRSVVGRAALHAGVLPALLPEGSVVGRRPLVGEAG